ncbi:jg7219 [Pararge aegeria aegeria]|uniref:Jg7219 protein n=1 Tax=Pararge aegeria aegeria TaxID=348720 RepID=A0A8S4S612_9NEOP|nr:jg7219 [Pararge aegeria aegeria]
MNAVKAPCFVQQFYRKELRTICFFVDEGYCLLGHVYNIVAYEDLEHRRLLVECIWGQHGSLAGDSAIAINSNGVKPTWTAVAAPDWRHPVIHGLRHLESGCNGSTVPQSQVNLS